MMKLATMAVSILLIGSCIAATDGEKKWMADGVDYGLTVGEIYGAAKVQRQLTINHNDPAEIEEFNERILPIVLKQIRDHNDFVRETFTDPAIAGKLILKEIEPIS